jgi:endo-1,4-beta-xylanase
MNQRLLAVAWLAISLSAACAVADVPETYRKMWDGVARQIDQGIERHRKGDATVEVVGADGRPVAGASLEIRQKTHEFLFGCNLFAIGQLDTPELNRKYEEAFARINNFATLPFYWRELEPEDGKPRFAEGSSRIWRRPPPDQLVKWCKARGITTKGHALMYSKTKFMPDWIQRDDPQRLKTLSERHMKEIAERYGRDIAVWDVVNEELPRLSNPHEWHAVPDDYLAWCFEEAGRLFPQSARLLINDGIHQSHITTDKYEELVKGLLERKRRVEGIGIQFHTSRGSMLSGKVYSPGHMIAVYERLGRLGLPLYITEITVPSVGQHGPAEQAAIVANLYRLWFSTPSMAGVTWWNLADGTAYMSENEALGGLLDKSMEPKPAYQALDKLINHEWKTKLAAKTDAQGKASFRGFCGKYTVRVTAGNQSRPYEIEVSKGGQAQHKLTWKP